MQVRKNKKRILNIEVKETLIAEIRKTGNLKLLP